MPWICVPLQNHPSPFPQPAIPFRPSQFVYELFTNWALLTSCGLRKEVLLCIRVRVRVSVHYGGWICGYVLCSQCNNISMLLLWANFHIITQCIHCCNVPYFLWMEQRVCVGGGGDGVTGIGWEKKKHCSNQSFKTGAKSCLAKQMIMMLVSQYMTYL